MVTFLHLQIKKSFQISTDDKFNMLSIDFWHLHCDYWYYYLVLVCIYFLYFRLKERSSVALSWGFGVDLFLIGELWLEGVM